MESAKIQEARPLKENVANVSSGRMRIRLIEGDRWGSSGYYTSEMLKRDGPKAFPAGTQMYLDHPTETEEWDRPERSVRDLAGVLESDATYQKDGLYADVKVYGPWAPVIAEMASDIGVSIRARASAKDGTIDGRSGLIFKELIEGVSVDFVTKAGAGGKIVQLIESAREAMKEEVKEEVKEASTNNRRIQLQKAIQAAYGGDDAWINDFDETERIVYFTSYQEGIGMRKYAQKFATASDDNSASLEGERWEVMVQFNYVPVPTTSSNPVQESEPNEKETTMGETTIQESELTTLRESAGRAQTLETELAEARESGKKSAVLAVKENRRANREQARRIVGEALNAAGVKAPSLAVAFSADPPLIEEGKDNAGTVDEARLKEQVKEAIGEIQVELDESTGGVRGFGASKDKEAEISEADLDRLAASAFGREEVKG